MFSLKVKFVDSIILIGSICVLLYWYLTKNFQYWKKRNVKGNKPYPMIGTLRGEFLLKIHPAFQAQLLYHQYPEEKVVGAFRAGTPALLVRDPELIKAVLLKDFSSFQDRGFRPDTDREPILQHLFFLDGNEWKLLRQKLTPTFTSGKLRNMFPLMIECGQQFKQYLSDAVAQGKTPEIKEATAKYTTDIIGSCAFGIKMNSLQDEETYFRKMGKKVFDLSLIEGFQLFVFLFLPSVYSFFKFRISNMEVQKFFIGLVKSVMQSRDNKPSPRNDFIDILIDLKSKSMVETDTQSSTNDLKLTDELLTAQAFVFFAAGFETASSTMTAALYEIAKHPEIQEKLVKEIKSVLSKNNGKFTYESVYEMTYLRMVIDETLRKYPSVGVLDRVCNSKCTITGTDLELDKNVLLYIPVYALHHDPQYYPEPEKFIPERFTTEAIAERHPFVYLPFGDGPRICIGMRFGLLQTMVGLISVLENFKVAVNDKTVPKIGISPKSFVMTCKDKIDLTLHKRQK